MTPASGPPPDRRYGHPLTLAVVASRALVAGAAGKVTAVSGSSLTARSADNYTRTCQVTPAARAVPGHGISSVKAGDQVRVMATGHGPAATVTTVTDLPQLRSQGLLPGGGQHWPASRSGG